MEKIVKMGDGECCPEGEICEEPESDEAKMDKRLAERGIKIDRDYINPLAVPYVQSDHLKELIAKKEKKDEKLKIVQKKT
jgi:hypothetical protein